MIWHASATKKRAIRAVACDSLVVSQSARMSETPHEAVRRALELLTSGLTPFVREELQRVYGEDLSRVSARSGSSGRRGDPWDAQALLAIIGDNWAIFRSRLGHSGRALVSELRETRNRWAHQGSFSTEDAYRAVDSVYRLLALISVPEVTQVESLRKTTLGALAGSRTAATTGVASRQRRPIPPLPPPQLTSALGGNNVGARLIGHSSPPTGGIRGHDEVSILIDGFSEVFRRDPRRFSSSSAGHAGCSDGNAGVQWNTWIDFEKDALYLGVNLEGITYDDWPIARLVERELDQPRLPALSSQLSFASQIEVCLWREAWQASSRVKIREHDLMAPTPLDRLTPSSWREALAEALGCLDERRAYRGRRKVLVTLAASGKQVERWVSPHLNCRTTLTAGCSRDRATISRQLSDARTRMQPIYDLVEEQSR